jgi:hypothetical protein
VTPQQFDATYRSVANAVSAGTGIDPIALETQWANETSWGVSWAGAPYNLGNIESNGKVVQYSSFPEFINACIAVFHEPPYRAVLAANNAVDQLAAIVASPWSAGHYGGSLAGYYAQLEEFELTPQEHAWLNELHSVYVTRNKPIPPNTPQGETMLDWFTRWDGELTNIVAMLQKIPPGGGLTPAQAQQLTDTLAAAQKISGALRQGLANPSA